MNERFDSVTAYFRRILLDLGVPSNAKLLDFGCGIGEHTRSYLRAGFDAYGCDVADIANDARIKVIESPYRLPFDDESFDVAVSTSVLEHARNTEVVYREIKRVLKPGGVAVHLFPARHYLPREPHIYVPFANWFHPDWWLRMWAVLGSRNAHQRSMSVDEVVNANIEFCRDGIHYIGCAEHERLSIAIFGNYRWAMDLLFKHSEGRFADLARRLRFLPWGFIGRHFRMALLVQVKQREARSLA